MQNKQRKSEQTIYFDFSLPLPLAGGFFSKKTSFQFFQA
jgi:hypothetical protein